MTKLGVQGGPEEEVKQDVAKDPKVFTVVQPTFVPIPIQNTEPMRKSVPSTWCLMARLLALVLIGSLLFSLLVFVVWNKDEVARAISGDKSTQFRTVSEPQFAALNSQAQQAEKAAEPKEEGAHITIKQTDEGTQMTIELPKPAEETKDGAKTTEGAAIPILQLVPGSRSDESSSEQHDESNEMDEPRRPMHPYEMEGPSPDALNFGMHPLMALQAARAAQYENEMRAWRMRRLQQMLVLTAVQQAQQREAAMRYAFFQRQQWAAQQMGMQREMEARRQAEWQEYWRRAAIARMMQQQQAMQMQQQPVGASWQAAEQPRPWWIQQQQQQPMMMHPFWQQQQMQQQQPMHPFWQQQQQQQQPQQMPFLQQQQPMMMHPFWQQQQMQQQQMQQQQQPQPAFENQGAQMQPQEQSSEEQQPQQPQPHAFIFIRRFFPIPQDSRESSQPAPASSSSSSSSSSEESTEKNIPLRPHDASAQQIVEQMRGGQQPQAAALPDAPIPGIHDRIFQHFQTLSQQIADRSGSSQQQSQPPLFASIPNSVEGQSDSQPQSQEKYDQDAIYEKLQRKAMELQQEAKTESVQVADSSASHSKEDSSVVGEDDHDIRRGDAVLGADDKNAQIDSDLRTTTELPLTTTTEPVMIENFVRAQSQEKDDDDEEDEKDQLTPEEKRRVAALDSAELKEAAALEASLEREANEARVKAQEERDRAKIAKIEEDIVQAANKDSSSSSSEEKKDEKEEEEKPVAATTLDPLSEFFRFFENEAVKLSHQDKSGERVVVDSETASRHPAVVDEVNDEENSSETKADEQPEELPAVDAASKDEEVSASIDTAPVSNEAEIKVSQVANSREIPTITLATAA